MTACIVEQSDHLRPNDRVDGVERSEEHDIVGLHVRVDEIELVVGMILVENVLCIVVFVEERQRNGRLGVGEHVHVVGIHAILFQKVDDVPAHAVAAGLTDKGAVHPRTPQRDDGIERGTTRISPDGLPVFKDNVEHGLSYSDNFAHDDNC